MPSDASGQIDVDALGRMIMPETRLIAITHVPTQGGLVNPVEEVGRITRERGILYLLDACQSVGQIDVDVARIGCDILSGTGRKFLRGPRGTGFLYVRKGVIDRIDPPFIDLLSATWTDTNAFEYAAGARRFETWESFVAGRVALTAAVRYAREIGMGNIETRVEGLARDLRDELARLHGVEVHDLGRRKCGIVTFTKTGIDPSDMADKLRRANINVSVSPLTYARLDMAARDLPALTRASVHYFNTRAEIDRFVTAIDMA